MRTINIKPIGVNRPTRPLNIINIMLKDQVKDHLSVVL